MPPGEHPAIPSHTTHAYREWHKCTHSGAEPRIAQISKSASNMRAPVKHAAHSQMLDMEATICRESPDAHLEFKFESHILDERTGEAFAGAQVQPRER